jgi:uncharacterized metal-binding protein YceD (DUF177 family)
MALKVQPEFSRPIPIEDIGEGTERHIEARPAELKALARRMKLPAIHALKADLAIRPRGKGGYEVAGRLTASIDQECVRTLDIFTSELATDVRRLYVPADSPAARAWEENPVQELEEDADETPDIIEDASIDLGELVAQTLALSLEPWPKKPGTDYLDYSTGG